MSASESTAHRAIRFQHPCGGNRSRLGRLWLIPERNYATPAIGSTRLGSLFLTLPTRALTGQQIISSEGDAFKIVERTGERWFAAELNRHKGQFLHRASCCPKN